MRELTESIIRFYLAVSLLGIKESTNLLAQYKPIESSDELEQVTQVAISQLDSYLNNLFKAGNAVQKNVFDIGFGFLDPALWNPARFFPAGKRCINYGEEWKPMPPLD